MKIAIVITAKNEERLLRNNLKYHFAIGVCKAFIYFDGATDNGPQSIANMPSVEVQNSVSADVYRSYEYLNKFTSNAAEHHTARQCLNTYDAKLKCKKEGIDWLISIDADELIIADKTQPIQLTELFTNIPSHVDLVHFDTKEAVQRKTHYHNVFAEETLYKTTHKFNRKIDDIIKLIHDPFLNKKTKISYWMGQFQGKSAIRAASDLIPKNVHRYNRKNGDKVQQVKKGLVLHFHAYDSMDFLKKFKNFVKHPDHFLAGSNVGYVKRLWRDIVNSDSLDKDYINSYFENNILFTEKEIDSMSKGFLGIIPRKQPAFEEITSVEKVFESLES